MLGLSRYEDVIEELEPGQTIRINHDVCEAGEDTRRRLYLTRVLANPEVVLAYCHNCQQSGAHKDHAYLNYRDQKHSTYPVEQQDTIKDNVTEPEGLIHTLSEWPNDGKSWAFGNGLANDDIAAYGIAFDPNTERVYIPRWDKINRSSSPFTGTLVGYQLRNVRKNREPKYLTVQAKDAPNWTRIVPTHDNWNYTVLVEDLVSAIHIIKATEEDNNGANYPGVIVNYGTKVDPVLMHWLASDFEWVTIWLDNDNAHVIDQAKTMERTIKLYSDTIKVARVEGHSDPKHYSNYEIREELDEVWHG